MSKNTLVIGASLKGHRYSNIAIKRLVTKGHNVMAIGLREGKVAGVEIVDEKLNFKNIDTVTLYLNPSRQAIYYEYILSLNPQRVIFNPGTENPAFVELLRKQDIHAEVACTLVLLSTDQY